LTLGSETTARNPTQLSLSPLFQYHYSMIDKVSKEFGEQFNAADNLAIKSELRQIFFKKLSGQSEYRTSTDFTTMHKFELLTLAERGFVNIPNNRIYGNKPIDIGYYISSINLHLYDERHPSAWSIPLDNLLVEVQADKIDVIAKPIDEKVEYETTLAKGCEIIVCIYR